MRAFYLLREGAVEHRNAIFQRRHHRGGMTAQHTAFDIELREGVFECRGPLLRLTELGVNLTGTRRLDQQHGGDRGGEGETAAPRGPGTSAAGPPGAEPRLHRRPPIPRRSEGRQRIQLCHALVQLLLLRLTRPAGGDVPARPHRRFTCLQRLQIIHCAMHHVLAPSSSIRRRRAWARASCDFEKLTDLPICSAISSCVYPSTSCSHTTDRDVSDKCSNAPSRSILAPTCIPPPGFPGTSSSSSVART